MDGVVHDNNMHCIAVPVASSGIDALLMEGGTTAHSRFKIPINITEDSVCTMCVQSHEAQLLCLAGIIV